MTQGNKYGGKGFHGMVVRAPTWRTVAVNSPPPAT